MGAAAGRIDGWLFMAGLIAGIWGFAEMYPVLAGFVWSGSIQAPTFAELLGVPFWMLSVAVVAMALGMFRLIGKLEVRLGGQRSD